MLSNSMRSHPAAFLTLLLAIVLLPACSGPNRERPAAVADATSTPTTRPGSPVSTATPAAPATTPPPVVAITPTPTEQPWPTATAPPPAATVPADATVSPTTTPEPPAPEATSTPQPTPVPDLPIFDAQRVTLGIERVGGGFTQPVYVTHAGDGTGQLYVMEKVGTIRLLDGTLFLDIRDRVIDTGVFSYEREQGLLGLAFHPHYADNGYFYVHYNDRTGQHVFSRFTRGADGLANRASEHIFLTYRQPEVNFNGGMLEFGADGYLYLGLGTGGTAVELQDNSQDLGTLLGKILRIDVDRGDRYAIPPDNPFVGVPGAREEIWLLGLRNPYRFSFDRATGDLYIGGPGHFRREWIEFKRANAPAGLNFGWPILEGSICWVDYQGACTTEGFELPIAEYETYVDGNCVVISGYVYRGERYPPLQGAFLFGDFCSGRVWTVAPNAQGQWVQTEMLRTGVMISSFGEDEAGEVYITDIDGGGIYRITASPR
jgi:glucose/arabinose dehydrogenase